VKRSAVAWGTLRANDGRMRFARMLPFAVVAAGATGCPAEVHTSPADDGTTDAEGGGRAADDPCVAYCDAVRAADCADSYTPRCDRECGIGRDHTEREGCSEEFAAELGCYVERGIGCASGELELDRDGCEEATSRADACLGLL
jgi:hypothetical protein